MCKNLHNVVLHRICQRIPGRMVGDSSSLATPDLHLVENMDSYKIPGLKGSLVPGDLFANLVWYQNHDPAELKRILTDSEDVSHKYSLRIGKIDSKVKEEQGKVAAAILPPQLAEVCRKSNLLSS